jgi:hypothetical protein
MKWAGAKLHTASGRRLVWHRYQNRFLFVLVYAFYVPRRWFLAMWVVTASALSYLPYLFGVEAVPRSMLSAVMAAALGVVARDLVLAVEHPVLAPAQQSS